MAECSCGLVFEMHGSGGPSWTAVQYATICACSGLIIVLSNSQALPDEKMLKGRLPMNDIRVIDVSNYCGSSTLQIFEIPVDHMLKLMVGIFLFNTLLVRIQFVIAREKPLAVDPDGKLPGLCSPVTDVTKASKDCSRLPAPSQDSVRHS